MKTLKQLSLAMTAVALILLGLVLFVNFVGFPQAASGLRGADELTELWPAPDFMLTDQAGELTTAEDLRGQVWAVDFFFMNCTAICPMLAEKMQWLSDELADHPQRREMRLVSISLDPDRDTPDVLADYAEALEAVPDEWLFLTGQTRQEVWKISSEGFRLAVTDTPDDPANPIAHTGKIALVDRDGQVRGYYDGLTPEGVKELKRDMLRLVERP
ncbi:MAG: SCO family protein [Planctomycetota bacterium]